MLVGMQSTASTGESGHCPCPPARPGQAHTGVQSLGFQHQVERMLHRVLLSSPEHVWKVLWGFKTLPLPWGSRWVFLKAECGAPSAGPPSAGPPGRRLWPAALTRPQKRCELEVFPCSFTLLSGKLRVGFSFENQKIPQVLLFEIIFPPVP